MPGPVGTDEKINLSRISFLLVDDNQTSLDITASVVSGFGVRKIVKCQSATDAKEIIRRQSIDFVIADARLEGEDGFAFLEWLRRKADEPTRYIPAIMTASHTRAGDVMRARDCGAHFLVTKPLTPKVMLDRIFWVAKDERLFVTSDNYVGPDRRFKRVGPPKGMKGRRSDDLSGKVGLAKEPNLSQDEINEMMKPTKVSL